MRDPRLFLHTSNRMEELAAMLAEMIGPGSESDPFCPETVLVQSRGMARWLSLELARARGICFNVHFPFPRQMVERILEALLPDWTPPAAFTREAMTWSLFELLGKRRDDARFSAIAHYLSDADPLKRMQLADRLAYLFDQYIVYRPDMLTAWEEEAGDATSDWQAILWRELVDRADGGRHFGNAFESVQKLESANVPKGERPFPRRIFAFGISSIPPMFLGVFRAYAMLAGELHLFLLQPTDAYWGDLVSKKKQASAAWRAGKEEEELWGDEGHPLIASLGRQGQDLLNLLIDSGWDNNPSGERFITPEGDTLLHSLQADMRALRDRGSPEEKRYPVAENDGSIEVHSCHSPMREVEVLHDQLLDRFAKNPDLRPRDVLVMIPDIELYAPYIEAVFGGGEDGPRIPYSVVDRRPRSSYRAIDIWFRLLELAGGRFEAREVISLLESALFQERFSLNQREIAMLREWIGATGIRWGIDAAHRETLGLPPYGESSWEAGIEQWLFGYAMRDSAEVNLPEEFPIPFDEIEGGNIGLLDRFLSVLDFLFGVRRQVAGRRTGEEWHAVLGEILETLFGDLEEIAHETETIRRGIETLKENSRFADPAETVPLDVVRFFLEKTIDDTVSGGRFLSGGVTFCTLQPMRMIPAKVVCLLGMDDNAYPRRAPEMGFDRMRLERRIGDRSVREDDRYLFLETLLSAREHLLISYVGQSARDLTELPPSVLVSELLDCLDRTCCFPDGRSAREHLVIRHRLQPFHPDYFAGGRLFSYSEEDADACRRLLAGQKADRSDFAGEPLPEPEEIYRTVEPRALVRFYRNPAEYFVRERLGLRFPLEEEAMDETEKFSLNGLDEYGLKSVISAELLHGGGSGDGWRRAQARGRAPLGTPGIAICESLRERTAVFVNRIRKETGSAHGENRQIERAIGEFRIQGKIGPFFGGRLVVWRPAKLKPKDYLAAWIAHLFASWESPGEVETVLIGEDGTLRIPARDDAEERIARLLEWYWAGLREPLRFYAETSYAFQAAVADGKGEEAALDKAWAVFAEDSFSGRSAEASDAFIALCWGGERMGEALGGEFADAADALFGEILTLQLENGENHG